jgi:hypothetical protein
MRKGASLLGSGGGSWDQERDKSDGSRRVPCRPA